VSEVRRLTKDFSVEEREQLLKQFHVSGLRYDEFAREHNINAQSFKNWVWIERRPNGAPKQYSPVERKKIVESFLSEQAPMEVFAKTWGISSATLRIWVDRYNEFGSDGLMNKRASGKDKRIGMRVPESVRSEIIQVKRKDPSFGLKKIKHWMYRFRGVKISTGTVRKTIKAEGIELVKIKKKRKLSSQKVRRFERAKPMQLWQSDITQFTVGQHSMRVYLTIFMDDHSRFIVGWRLQSRQTADLVIDTLKDAFVKYGKPEEVLTDQGRQYFAWRGKSELEKLLEKENIKHVVSRAHHPQTLGKCERFWETVGNEFWTRIRPFDLDEARERLKYYIDHYNYQRPHQGLDGQVPADRFFGVAADVRAVLEKSVRENSLRIATGDLPRPPAFLIGQVGDQRIAFHGTAGSFYLNNEHINGDINANTGNITNNNHADQELSTQAMPGETPQGIAISSDQATMGAIQPRGAEPSSEDVGIDPGVLAGPHHKTCSSREPSDQADTVLATEYAGHFGNERGFVNESPQI
jgi:putative transposase